MIRAAAPCTKCDENTARYLAGEQTQWADEQMKAALAEIEGLKDAGLLYKEEVHTAPVKSHEVKALCIHICHDCNLRCKYCFADEGAYHAAREMMSSETAKRAIDFLIANSGSRRVLEVDFFGGEPLMNLSVIKETVAYAKAEAAKRGKRFLFTTTTNGLLLNDDAIEFLNAEMENVVLSLDGRRRCMTPSARRSPARAALIAVIDKIKKFVSIRGDKHYYVRGTFTAKNLDFSQGRPLPRRSGIYLPVRRARRHGHSRIADRGGASAADRSGVRKALRRIYPPRGGGEGLFLLPLPTSISRAVPACKSASRRAARATSISPSFPTATSIPATSSRATRSGRWATSMRANSTGRSAACSPRPVSSRAISATAVLPSSSARAGAAPTTITTTAISTNPTR